MSGSSTWVEETNDFILRNVLYLLYGSDKAKKPMEDGSQGILKNPEKTDYFKSMEDYQQFLDLHFAGYLSLERKAGTYYMAGIEIASYVKPHFLTDAVGDLLSGRKNSKRRGKQIRKSLIERIKANGRNKEGFLQIVNGVEYEAGFSKVIDDIEYANYYILKAWDLNLEETVEKLNQFMKRMEQGEDEGFEKKKNLIEFSSKMKREYFSLIQAQIDQKNWESLATAITWLLLLALFREEAEEIEVYCRNMGVAHMDSCDREAVVDFVEKQMCVKWKKEETEKETELNEKTKDFHSAVKKKGNTRSIRKSRYAPPNKIRPFTMESIGNLRNTYVERTDILQVLDEMFWGETGKAGEKRYVYLSGMGGDGKSELARAYAYHHQADYDDIFWLTCQDGKTSELEALLKENGYLIEQEDRDVLSEHTLLIVDNCNAISAPFLRQLHNETGRAHLLVTTRLGQISSVDERYILPVFADEGQILQPGNCRRFSHSDLQNAEEAQVEKNILTQEEFACQIFYRNYFASLCAPKEADEQLTAQERENVRKICRCVGNHPMTVAMIAVMLRENQEDYSIDEFRENSRSNLRGAIPSYLNIPFGQNGEDYEDEPLELLRKLFTCFLKEPFTLPERQVLNLLHLVPARSLNMKNVCELLGDTGHNMAIKNACKKLWTLNWIQSDGVWMSMHPLISEVLELEPEKIEIENRELFFQEVLKRWLAGNIQKSDECLMYYVWEESGIQEEESDFNLAVCSVLQKADAKILFTRIKPDVNRAFTAFVDCEGRRTFLYYDLEKKEEIAFYSLEKQNGTKTKSRQKAKKWQKSKSGQEIEREQEQNVVLLYLVWGNVSANLEFPDKILECPITEIPDSFCRQAEKITGLWLPDGLKRIGDYAFESCVGLKSELKLPESLKEIGKNAFSLCMDLHGDLIIPDNITKIQKETFAHCKFKGNLIIGENVEEIDDSAFLYCDLRGTVQFGEKIWRIGKGAFAENYNLEEIILSEGLEVIDEKAFYLCRNLKNELYLPTTLKKIEKSAFEMCTELCGEICIPQKMEFLGESVFTDCKKLSGKVVILENGLEVIKKRTFAGCTKIESVKFHKNIKRIEKEAFADCSGLQGSIELPDMLEILGEEVFKGCTGLKEVIFNTKVTKIEKNTFLNCSGLEYVKLPEELEIIGKYAFKECFSLKKVSDFPDKLKEIAEGAFSLCRNLKMDIKFPLQLKKIGEFTFAQCEQLYGELKFGEELQEIGKYAFLKCNHLTGDVRMPAKLRIIREGVFAFCTGLNGEIFFSDKLELIEKEAFRECINIRGKLQFPSSLKRIDSMAFKQCENLEGPVTFQEGIASIGFGAFSGCVNLSGDLFLPESLHEIYSNSFEGCEKLNGLDKISDLLKKVKVETGSIGELIIDKNMTVIDQLWVNKRRGHLPKKITIPDQITRLNTMAFSDLDMEYVQLSSNMEEIGEGALLNCYNLTTISEFPLSLKRIQKMAFAECSNMEIELKLPDSLEEIGIAAFSMCKKLYGKVVFPEKITQINEGTFMGCSNLEEIIFSHSVKSIKSCAFSFCFSLRKIQFAEELQEIDSLAFAGCSALERVEFPTGLKRIGEEAFSKCLELRDITFSEGLEVIEKGAFINDYMLEGPLKFPDTLKEIGEKVFGQCLHLTGDLILPENMERIGSKAFQLCNFSNIVLKNPSVFIGDGALGHTTAVIWGYWNSTAHIYAKKYGHKFRDIKDWPDF